MANEDITFWWRCEGTTLDHPGNDYSDGDVVAALQSAAAINAAASYSGTNGLDCPGASDWAEFDWDNATGDLYNPTEGGIGFWFRVTTWDSWATLASVYVDASNSWLLRITDTYDIQLWFEEGNVSKNIITTGNALATGNWYFLWYKWKASANDRVFTIYNSSGTEVDSAEDLTTSFVGMTPDAGSYLRIGNPSNNPADIHLDLVKLTDDYERDLHAIRDTENMPSGLITRAVAGGFGFAGAVDRAATFPRDIEGIV